MKLMALLKGDFKTQYKYGLLTLYLFLSVLYAAVLFLLPKEARETAAVIMIYTDPGAVGLFFLGAMVLFEQSQKVVHSLAVAPISSSGYVLSKLLTLSFVSLAAGLLIALVSGAKLPLLLLAAGVFLGSLLFSAVGMILAAHADTLNGFLLRTIPAELLIILPAMAWLFGFRPNYMVLHPGVCAMILFRGQGPVLTALMILLAWTAGVYLLAARAADRMFLKMGGGAL